VTFALFTAHARVLLGLAALGLGIVALGLRLAKVPERFFAPPAIACGLALVALAGEQVIAFAIGRAAPSGLDFNEWRWVVSAPWGRVGIAVGLGLIGLTLILAWYGTRRETRLLRRTLIVGLRAGACAAAAILFLEPALELRHVTREPNHVAVLVDDSLSMDLAEKKGETTREQRAASIIAKSSTTFDRWRGDHDVDFFTFSDSVLAAGEKQLAAGTPARGDATQLREALENVRARYDQRDLAGIVVVSDGVASGRFDSGVEDGASQDFLSGLGVKVHTIWAGRPGLVDLAVARVDAPDFAYVRTTLKIDAIIQATGVSQMDIPVTLRKDGEVVKQQVVTIGGSHSEQTVTFELAPDRIGKYVFQVSVPVLSDESVPENNERSFVMRVGREKTRVLQVAGEPSWDEEALRRFFKTDTNVDLISFFILRTPEDVQLTSPDELSLIPFPTRELFEDQLGSFDVIILQNFEPLPYGIEPYLDNIRDYVDKGGALAMLGGERSFSSGRYDGTPVADALPVDLLPSGFGTADHSRLENDAPFVPRLTVDGATHPITQLRFDPHDNAARWESLPPLDGVNLVAGARANATVLLEHPTLKGRGGKPLPVLTVGEFGKGRVMALGVDTASNWGFRAAGKEGDDGRAYSKFWQNAVRWLIRDPDLEYLHVESDQAEYARGQAPRILARLVDPNYKPAKGDVTVTVAPAQPRNAAPILTKTVTTDETTGEAEIDLPSPAPGAYRVSASASPPALGGKKVTADDVFLVRADRAELERPAAREDILKGIARATGGRYLGTDDAIDAGLPLAPPRVVRVDKKSDVELWSRPHLFLLAIFLLGAEWAIRRRRGFL
jgi:uncharacterized membrane protein